MNYCINAILFDLDGVIVFTDQYHYLAWDKLAKEEGWSFSPSMNEKLRGVSRLESLEVILNNNDVVLSIEQKEILADRKNEYYLNKLQDIDHTAIFPGVVKFIKELRSKGTKIALCSSSKNANLILERLELKELFDVVITGNDILNSKPHPEIFLKAAEQLNIHPLNCMVFEDAISGIKAAAAAKMKCIGVGEGTINSAVEDSIKNYEEIDIEELLVSGRKKGMPVQDWCISETEINYKQFDYWGSIFAINNGYLGMRGSFEECGTKVDEYNSQGMYLNSVYCKEPHAPKYIRYTGDHEYWHAMINLFDWTRINILIEGEQFSLLSGSILEYNRELNMKKGVITMSVKWESPSGKRIALKVTKLCSMVKRHMAAIEYMVTPLNFSGEIQIESKVEHKVKNSQFGERPLKLLSTSMHRDIINFRYEVDVTKFQVVSMIGHRINGNVVNDFETNYDNDWFTWSTQITAECQKPIIFEKLACFYSSFDMPEDKIENLAFHDIRANMVNGFRQLEIDQIEYWNDFWEKHDIEVYGNIADQQALRFSIFHLRQSHPENERMSISATGITGHNYNGHVFWDTEMYMIPFFLYTNPELVKPLLMYRYNILDKARERAKEMAGEGALFSWMSINGEETNADYQCATAQYHINADIAYAIQSYYNNTKDLEFIDNYGAEVIFETAKFLYGRGRFIPLRNNQFCINMVCGPDEYGCMVNNNAYTNMMVKNHFEFAIQIWEDMRKRCPDLLTKLFDRIDMEEGHISNFRQAAASMFENFIPELGIHAQDDSYLYKDPVDMTKTPKNVDIRHRLHPLNAWRIQATKQADVVLMMLTLGEKFNAKVKKANYEFYEPKTVHSSSLSAGIHSIIAAEIGKLEEAYEYFQQSLYMDLKNLRRNTDAGIHFACLGATWMAMMNGFAGMRSYSDGLHFNPILPQSWSGYRFKIHYKGRCIQVVTTKKEIEYTLLTGEDIRIWSGSDEVLLTLLNTVVTKVINEV